MIPPKIKALFDFIDYLDENKVEFIEKYIPLSLEISDLDKKRSKLNRQKNYIDKQLYDRIQKEISEKCQSIDQNVSAPILKKLEDLDIWSGDEVYTSIWNSNFSSICDFKENFEPQDVSHVVAYKSKYLNFRNETSSGFSGLQFVFSNLDEILKQLFDFFKDSVENEFESFETKTIEVDTFKDAVKGIIDNRGKNVRFSVREVGSLDYKIRPEQLYSYNVKNEIIMGDKFENIQHSTIYNRASFKDAFNAINTDYNADIAQALDIVKSLVAKSGNIEAGELFDSFNEEVKKEHPKKSVLQSLWNGLTKIIPTISQTAGLVEKITPLFNS